MRLINALFGLFGYEWVLDETPIPDDKHHFTGAEEYDHLNAHTPRYILRKQPKSDF
ncbi:hypothetical protein THMIRHAS_02190 [Thiosulfatimonas sediminis]|uniref:Uncharacterized protein n=1 Tax=Thiosulfatimonas sediminis TaxID=2675054 RepID=A0A6F8PRY6_9GAMM|nr:hypothetical protein THMIRHAS_02190 [Thiosulfatimonas sediminis]